MAPSVNPLSRTQTTLDFTEPSNYNQPPPTLFSFFHQARTFISMKEGLLKGPWNEPALDYLKDSDRLRTPVDTRDQFCYRDLLEIHLRYDAKVGEVNSLVLALGGEILRMNKGYPVLIISMPLKKDINEVIEVRSTFSHWPGIEGIALYCNVLRPKTPAQNSPHPLMANGDPS